MPRQQNSQRISSERRVGQRSQPIVEVPSPEPHQLNEEATAYWNAIAPQLVAANILTPLHVDTFAALCRTYGEYILLSRWLDEDPGRYTFTMGDNNYQQISPQVTQRDKALAVLQKLWPMFGLHPKSLAEMRKHGGIAGGGKDLTEFAKGKYQKTEGE